MPENPNEEPQQGQNGLVSTNNRSNKQPRVSSAGLKYYDIATQLLGKQGSDLDELFIAAARDGSYDRIENFLQRRSDGIVSIDVKDKKTGNTPLIWAAKRGHAKIVQLLLRHGADVTLRNYEGQTAVEVASHAIKTLLLDSVERTTEASHRLLLQAAWQGNIKVVKKLLSSNKVLDINCQNADGLTPLLLVTRDIQVFERLSTQMCREYSPSDVIVELLSHRADVHACDSDGKTCLHHAAQSKALVAPLMVQTIITGSPDMEYKDKRCFTSLHCASLTGNADCVVRLLDGGSHVNSRGFAGATPLHITAYNNHEKATNVLLEKGADVTLTDDRGLTAVDFAKSRKIKGILKEAWSEAISRKSTTSLGPLRAPSREETRSSLENLSKSRRGEVIFDGMPSNPFSEKTGESTARSKGLTRHLSLKEKADRAEEQMMRDLENGNYGTPHAKDGVRRLGMLRNQQRPSPLPKSLSRSTERLPAISPDRVGVDPNRESPTPFNRFGRSRRSFDESRMMHSRGNRGSRIAPLSTREGTVSIRTIGDDLDNPTPRTPRGPSPTPSNKKSRHHQRSASDSVASPSLGDIAKSCDPYLLKRAPSNLSETQRQTPIRTPLDREITLMSVCSYRSESRMSTASNNTNLTSPRLNLGQMGLLPKSQTPVQNTPLYPTSSKVLPPTPTFMTQRCFTMDPKLVETSAEGMESPKDLSPRSDEEIKLAFTNPTELLRSRSLLKEQFVLEESRPKDPFLHSSGSDTMSSSGSGSTGSSQFSSPRDGGPSRRKQEKFTGLKTGSSRSDFEPGRKTITVKEISTNSAKQSIASVNSQKEEIERQIIALRNAANNTTAKNKNKNSATKPAGVTGKTGGVITVHSNVVDTSTKCEDQDDDTSAEVDKIVDNVTKGKVDIQKRTSAILDKLNEIKDSLQRSKTSTDGMSEKSTGAKTSSSAKSGSKTNSVNSKSGLQVVPTKLIAKPADKTTSAGTSKTASVKDGSLSNKENLKSVEQGENIGQASVGESKVTNVVSDQGSAVSKGSVVVTNKETEQKSEGVSTKTVGSNNKAGSKIATSNRIVTPTGNRTVVQSSSAQASNRTLSRNGDSSNASKSAGAVKAGLSVFERLAKPATSPAAPKKTLSGNSGNNNATSSDKKSDLAMTSVGASTKEDSKVIVKEDTTVQSVTDTKIGTQSTTETVKQSAAQSASAKTNNTTGMSKPISATGNSRTVSKVNSSVQNKTSSASSQSSLSKSVPTITQPNSAQKANNTQSGAAATSTKGSAPKTVTTNSAARGTSAVKSSTTDRPSSGHKPNSGLSRSASTSAIQSQEKQQKLMSSSDTKINMHVVGIGSSLGDLSEKDGEKGTSDGLKFKPASAGKPPLVEILPAGTPRLKKSNYVEPPAPVQTPVIVNPFEEFEQYKPPDSKGISATAFGYVVEKPVIERSKTTISTKSQRSIRSAKKGKDLKPSSAGANRGRRKGAKSKESVKSEDAVALVPKNGTRKRVRSGKRRRKTAEESVLVKQAERSDVALISGIGWHLATSCLDTSDADAVVVRDIDSSDSEEDLSEGPVSKGPYHPNTQNPLHLQIFKPMDISSAVSSPRFLEVKPSLEEKPALPVMANDGFPPMNLDMTQTSLQASSSLNLDHQLGSGITPANIARNAVPNNINEILAKLRESDPNFENLPNPDIDDEEFEVPSETAEITAALHREILMGKLTPIPESPSHSHSRDQTLNLVPKTLEAINKFDRNLREEDLNLLLGVTPRDPQSSLQSSTEVPKSGSKFVNVDSKQNTQNKTKVTKGNSLRNSVSSSKSLSRSPNDSQDLDQSPASQHASADSKRASRNNSLRNSGSSVNRSMRSLAEPVPHDQSQTQQPFSASSAGKGGRTNSVQNSGSSVRSMSRKAKDLVIPEQQGKPKSDSALSVKTVSDPPGVLPQSLKDPLKGSSNPPSLCSQGYVKGKDRRKEAVSKSDIQLSVNVVEFDSDREGSENDFPVSSSRRERKFSETKPEEENMESVIDEILNNTYPSSRSSTLKGHDSLRSTGGTLTKADKKVLSELQSHAANSPFHAKKSPARVSTSYDETADTNPDFLKIFHADDFHLGQKMRALIDAGADKQKVKAMAEIDSEAKQIAKIMNSFRQMELYAGPANAKSGSLRLSKKDTPRKDTASLTKLDLNYGSTPPGQKPPSGRPGSAQGKVKSGRFTEIKQGRSAPHAERSSSPQPPKEQVKYPEYVEIPSEEGTEPLEELANIIRASSPDTEVVTSHLSRSNSLVRADSACTSVSSQSNEEDTIQWKKGNVLGKGAFGIVWCGLTSEGQLIAVKQIELNTAEEKAKREYEKVQEEVELLKTLNHKNIVGYLGTSLEDSVVSIFMQFVPGGSIASILARFGALDEAVFRRYTKQVLEGVEYLHENDVIHRDIKGGNVMLMPNGIIKLIDFGCAKRLCINLSMGQSQILKSMKGTPYWMAPEVVNESGHGKKSDIWSIGCTVFEMATRKPPWADMNPMAAIFAIGSDKPIPQLPDKFSQEAGDFVNACLTRDQSKRLSATELLQHAFIKRSRPKSEKQK